MYDRPFRWWVQSVMPLVFDDSLSYYEVLAKLTKYIEGLTGDVEQIEKILGTIEGIEDVTQFTEFLERIQAEIGNLENLQTDTKANLVSAINEVALKADIAYWKPPTGIPESDLSQEVKDKLNRTISQTEYIINNVKLKPAPTNNSPNDLGLGTYTVPDGGIPWDTLSDDVKNRINQGSSGGTTDYTALNNKPQINGHTLNAGNNTSESLELGTYSKPNTGIPESDLSAEVQEKLNTSGGIADNQQTFVASRDYEAGELVYINGVLYRTKYKILTGTNMIPGNNIEVTDISAELEKINNDIDALQSGAGPDSWNLSTTVHSSHSLDIVNFFEYFNCVGGETYNFIVEPIDPSIADAYTLNICKRDGSIVKTEIVTSNVDYANRFRFTFTPTDSGEYFCKFHRYTNGTNVSAYKVTIEYTQSQGMSELWNQVNQSAQLTPRVAAVEELVSQHTIQLQELDDIPDKVEAIESDVDTLKGALGSGLFVDGTAIDISSNITNNVWLSGNVGETLVTHNAGATANTFFDATEGSAYKISFQAMSTAEKTYIFAVDANGIILKTWVTAALVSNERRDVYVIAPPNTSKIYFNFQRYNYKAVCNATQLSVEDAFPMPSRNDWKKAFRLQDNFVWEGCYIKADGGAMFTSSAWKATDYIPVNSGDVLRYRLCGGANAFAAICFYDVHKVYIRSIPYVAADGYFANGRVTVENDGFIRLSALKTDISSWLVWDEYNPTDSTKHAIEQHTVIADFLEDEYRETIESLQAVNSANGSSFIFFTDLHYAVNHRYSDQQSVMERNYTAIKRLSDEYPIAVVIAGGDYEMLGNVASGVTKQDGLDIIYHMNRYMSQMDTPKIAMCGNHELGYNSGGSAATIAGTDNGLTVDEIYQYIGKKYASNPIVKVGKKVYYLNDQIDEVFYLFCSTPTPGGLTDSVVANDIVTAVNANSEHYPIVIFNHYSLNGSGEIFNEAITTTINTIVNAGHTIIAWIGGHNHADWCNTVDVNGTKVLVISCLQSGVLNSEESEDGNTYTHTVGTDTESAFSVFTINKELGKLYLTRFGAGVDREFNYNTTSGAVGLVTT